jgi:hypothetical protein
MISAANENDPAGEPERPLDWNERTALAILRCGRSFAEAAETSGVPLARLMTLWRERAH